MTDEVLDKLGIWASSLCALHCLLLPVLIPLVPLLGASIFAEEWFEHGILVASVIIGFSALFSGFYRYHKRLYPVYGFALGAVLYWNKDSFGETLEPYTVVLGALLIIAAHVINLRLCRSCKSCADKACDA